MNDCLNVYKDENFRREGLATERLYICPSFDAKNLWDGRIFLSPIKNV